MGVHQTAIAYSTLGSATLMYSLLAYFGVMPQDGRVALLICADHFKPFSATCASCTFHLRFWSKITPRYLALVVGVIDLCGRCSCGRGLELFWWAKSISASLLYSRGEL